MMLERMSGETDPRRLEVLAGTVQPPEGYAREELKQYDSLTPLNRMVDAIPPESQTAREFSLLVKSIVSGSASADDWQRARSRLVMWRDNDAALQPHLSKSDMTEELIPVSRTLSEVAAIGLRAIDTLEHQHEYEPQQIQEDLQTLKAAEKPQAVLRDMIVPPVEDLVKKAGQSSGAATPGSDR
jgi:hexosaminidase